MHRALWPVLSVALALGSAGCGRPRHQAEARAPSACDSAPTSGDERLVEPLAEPDWGATVTAIELRGLRAVPEALVRAAIATRVGSPLDETRVATDVRNLYALEAFEQISAETEAHAGGVRLGFVLRERPLVQRVEHRGPLPAGRYLPVAPGELHDPARARRAAQGLEDHLVESGHLDARVTSKARVRGEGVDLCFLVTAGPRYLIREIVPVGNATVDRTTLLSLVDDHEGTVNRPGAPFRPDLLEPARTRFLALYYERGFLDVEVGEPRALRNEQSRTLRVEWPIDEGAVYRISGARFSGRLRAPEARYRELLGLTPGQVFARTALAAGLERIRLHHEKLGRTAEATPELELDHSSHTVKLNVRVEERSR